MALALLTALFGGLSTPVGVLWIRERNALAASRARVAAFEREALAALDRHEFIGPGREGRRLRPLGNGPRDQRRQGV